ncbi:MAG: hypothetical protein HYV76_01620 [Candidatus Vogelbacteria bacterium]|nr:hypothetical protein [Candidatus Vogelbacteria bacterium]
MGFPLPIQQKYSFKEVNNFTESLFNTISMVCHLVDRFKLLEKIMLKIDLGFEHLEHTEFDRAMSVLEDADRHFSNVAASFIRKAPDTRFQYEISKLRNAGAGKNITKFVHDEVANLREIVSAEHFDIIEAAEQYSRTMEAVQKAHQHLAKQEEKRTRRRLEREAAALLEAARPLAEAGAVRWKKAFEGLLSSGIVA